MSKRKTRERQLAKLAARRAAERRRRRRKRILGGAVGGAAFLAVALILVFALTGGDGKSKPNRAANRPSTPAASPSAAYSPGTGKQTGTVKPEPAPKDVACGAEAPPEAGKQKPQFDGPPPITIDPANTYTATMKTSCGTITIELLADSAPYTVNSFVFLAHHHYFDGQYFHRLDTSIDVVQGGDPMGTGSGGPGYAIPDELTGHDTYGPGTLAMANSGPNTGGSQFFIITGPNGHKLDDNATYTVFGKIVRGLDVAQRIQKLPIPDPSAGPGPGQRPEQSIYIDAVTIEVKKPKPATVSPLPSPKTSPTRTKK